MLSRAAALALTCLAALAGAANAEPRIEKEFLTAEFLPENAVTAPGDTVSVAMAVTLDEGWHTYWKNAGDSGEAVDVTWAAPEGVTVGPIQWPAPHRQPYPPLMNYGYSDEAAFLNDVTVPADWPAGKPLSLEADAYWLVCKEVCIPEMGKTTLTLQTGPETRPDDAARALFASARAAQAQPSPYATLHSIEEERVSLRIESPVFAEGKLEDAYFFPTGWGVIDHAAEQTLAMDAGGLTLSTLRGEGDMPEGPLEGVLEIVERGANGEMIRAALSVAALPGDVAAAAAVAGPVQSAGGGGPGLLMALVFAFLGGLILNLMPCVFPVLALKAVGFAQSAHGARADRVAHGLAYGAGVLTLFLILGGGLIALKAAGAAVGWGFQLQNPFIVAALAYLLFLVGLNLSGVFDIGAGRLAGVGAEAAGSGGARGAFFTGALAAVVATPCTAPFMGVAIGAALTMSAPATLAVFAALGLGLAAPFMALAFIPAAARMMPRPGAWMETFKQALAFPLYASAAWLVWVLGALAGPDAAFAALIGGVLIAFAAWAFAKGRFGAVAAVVAVLGAVALTSQMRGVERAPGMEAAISGPGEPFSKARFAALRSEGRPVFVNMTADWCITCKVNEKIAFRGDFEEALARNGVTYLLGDWTAYDPDITAMLERFDRAGVPLYAVFPREGEPILLPQILTPETVVAALDQV